jgi:hypothetical protein
MNTWCYTPIPPYVPEYEGIQTSLHLLLVKKKKRLHYIPHLTVECKENVITNESIPTFEKEIITSYPRLDVHVLKYPKNGTSLNL